MFMKRKKGLRLGISHVEDKNYKLNVTFLLIHFINKKTLGVICQQIQTNQKKSIKKNKQKNNRPGNKPY